MALPISSPDCRRQTLHRKEGPANMEKTKEHSVKNGEWLSLLLDSVTDYAIYAMDVTGCIKSWSAPSAHNTGYSEAEILGQHVSILYSPADREIGVPARQMEQALKHGRYEDRRPRFRKDGSSYWSNFVISPLHDHLGKHRGFSMISRDVTLDKAAADQALREQAEILDLAQIMVRNTQGRIEIWSSGAEKLYGYTRDEAVGRISHELLQTQFPEPLQQIEKNLEHRGGWEGELVHRTRDGRSVFTASVWVFCRASCGKSSRVLESNTDITALKQTQKRLAQKTDELISSQQSLEMRTKDLAKANETLESSNIELQQFAYVASHDLQSPLRSISGFVQLLQMEYEEKLDDQGRDYIRRTVLAITQMQTLIKDLLSYSRVESRSRPFLPVSLMDAFQLAVSLLDSSIRDTRGHVTCGQLPVVLGDNSQLAQVMQNLIGNGLKYHGSEPPRVHVSAERDKENNRWIISVQDNGIGIDPKYFSRIFEVFKRLHDSAEYPGTGIGLPVCRRVVERHGGAIWVESEPGHGSNFLFTIPAYARQGHNGGRDK
jgi:PAS domain S-box-containing protein